MGITLLLVHMIDSWRRAADILDMSSCSLKSVDLDCLNSNKSSKRFFKSFEQKREGDGAVISEVKGSQECSGVLLLVFPSDG